MRRVILMMLLAVVSSSAMTVHSEVLRCVTTTPGGLELTLNIVLPQDFNLTLTTTDKEGRLNSVIYGDSLTSIGEGVIEEKMLSRQAKRFPFVVTRLPSEMDSLTGFYIEDGTPIIVKVDSRVAGKPFLLYDPLFYSEAPLSGKCM